MDTQIVALILTAVLVVLLVIDWQQTLRIARDPARWQEMNPFLGPHPSVRKVHAWFALCTGVGVTAFWLLPPTPAFVGALIWTVAELACVVNNHRVGLDG